LKILLEGLNSEISKIKQAHNIEVKKSFDNLRKSTVIGFFSQCDSLVTISKKSFKTKVTIRF